MISEIQEEQDFKEKQIKNKSENMDKINSSNNKIPSKVEIITNKTKLRPQTPSIDVIAIRNSGENSGVIKNFSSFFKQIVSNENKNFLGGEVNMIEYIISKYSNISINNVSQLVKLHLKIHAEYNLLNQFGERLPNLKELKLNNSNIPSISDLGSNFKGLVVLYMDNCNLVDLSGIICFENLKEFSAKNNKINDLFEIESVTSIQYLQLENNLIEELENITFVSTLENLNTLILKGNPICTNNNYLNQIKKEIPWLKDLDTDYEQKISYDNPMFNATSSSFFNSSVNSNDSQKGSKNNELSNSISKKKNTLEPINANNNSLSQDSKNDNERNEIEEGIEGDFDNNEISSKYDKLDNRMDKSLVDSLTTNSQTNSFLASHSTFKSFNKKTNNNLLSQENPLIKSKGSNMFSINIDNNKLVKLGKLNPVKLKPNEEDEREEKEEMKKVFANHNECLDLDQEKEEIMKKLNKKGSSLNKELKSMK